LHFASGAENRILSCNFNGALGEIRTPDPRIRSPILRANNQALNATPCVKPLGKDQGVIEVLSNLPVVQRDDGKWSIGWHEDAPGPFSSRLDAERVANGDKLARAPARNFRRIKIREVRGMHPPDPEMRKGCPAKNSPNRKDHTPQQIIETRTDAQVGFLRQRLGVGYSLAAALAPLIFGLGPR
jgi:hypothetical protein